MEENGEIDDWFSLPQKKTLTNRKKAISMNKQMTSVISEMVTILEFTEAMNKESVISVDLVFRFFQINGSKKIFNQLLKSRLEKIETPSFELLKKIITRHYDPKFDRAIKEEYKSVFGTYFKQQNIALIVYHVASNLLNLDKSILDKEVKNKFYYYQQAYLQITNLVDKYYKLKYKKQFSHYSRAVIATDIVLQFGLAKSTKFKNNENDNYSESQLFDISKHGLKLIKVDFN